MAIPRERTFDATLALLSEGYVFISHRRQRYASDIFETRLMLRRVVCIGGAEASAQFYEPGRFTRRGAIPQLTLRSLQDRGSVATLDGAAHGRRKRMFMSLMTPVAIDLLGNIFEAELRARIPVWERSERIVLFDEMTAALTRAVCEWAGTPVDDGEARARADEFRAMIDGAGSAGPRNWRGLWLRRRTERWARENIESVRADRIAVPSESPLRVIAEHRSASGRQLPIHIAAVELINILRPTVAVARYMTFAALAIQEHDVSQDLLADDAALDSFVEEVRRFYPFFPAVGGRVLRPFEWRGHAFNRGDWVLLDLYGTNRDPRLWSGAEIFDARRFIERQPTPFDLIPQGGGDHLLNHRCPGEWITIELMKRAVKLLTTAIRYEVPPQDFEVPLNRFPTGPRSGFVISRVERRSGVE